jgi:CBS-domain-containing membrane protein
MNERIRTGTYAFGLCCVVLALAGVVGLVLKRPFLFPSLGPTVMLFFDSPTEPSAAPRNTLIGHGVGILAGLLSLQLFRLADHPPVIIEGLNGARIAAAALSVGLTVLVLRLLDSSHPPAGATTLIVSLGLLTSGSEILSMVLAIILVTFAAVAMNRAFNRPQPLWRPVGAREAARD